jgi:hypothetical protein
MYKVITSTHIQKMPEMEKPVMEFEISDVEGARIKEQEWKEYEAHLASLPKILRGDNNYWAIGDKVEKGVDFYTDISVSGPNKGKEVAYPIVPARTKETRPIETVFKEFIICSAIHFNDGKKYEHQPKNIELGFVVAGRRHHNCYATLSALGDALGLEERVRKLIDVIGRDKQGFITNTNRFVDRKEGMRITKAANQLINPSLHPEDEGILTSEDLY